MMSSASSFSTTCPGEHDVFLSFRGEDTRPGFTSHLYDALISKGIRTFKDDKKLETGYTIATELQRAIQKSRFAVVVFSRNFATSKWCLEEIAKIVDCREQRKLIVIPVFYHVDPSDVRHQTNSFEQAFAKYEIDANIMSKKVKTWRDALKSLGAIKGEHVIGQRDESEVITKIVGRIFKEIQDTVPTDIFNRLVGMESRVNEVKRMLSLEPCEVRFIGICGMSGMGKTTLAEAVYNEIKVDFQKRCFIENIKDVSKNNDSATLCKLQKKLLDEVLKDKIHVESVAHGQTLLGTLLRGLKVFIVLDDVNHVDQLMYLAGTREWFGPGTRIIVTTTDIDLLKLHKINEIYTCEGLKGFEALTLFCQSAFEQDHPTQGYEKLSDDIVGLAGGLPLALNVYGSLLCGKEEIYWETMLKKLGEYPSERILGRLEVVYARLDRDQQNTFMYIACFLKGRNIDLVKDILTNIGLHPRCEIPDLMSKFLVTINHDNSVWVHDLLQHMCWDILRKESERHTGKYIALKYRKDVEYILSREPKGTRSIEIINQEPYKVEGDDFIDEYNCFSKMMKLKFLRISKIDFDHGLDRLSNDIRVLEWYECSLKSFPSAFKPTHIFELEMCYSQLETLWGKHLDLPNLRSINLSFSTYLTELPDLTSTSKLEKLNLEGCTKLTELHESVLVQKRLQYLNLKNCTSLRSLSRSSMEMEALEALILSGCSNLEYIPEFGQNMKRLEHLYLDGTSIKELPDSVGRLCNLRKLDASETSIEEIPSSINQLKRLRLLRVHRCRILFKIGCFLHTNMDTLSSGLRELDLSYCNLSVVPDGIGMLHLLINLDLSGNDIVSLPASIGLLSNLRVLCLNDCKRLQSLPKLSIVNVETDYGPRDRFDYHISGQGVDVSKFYSTSNNSCPTVSCLNCPKLAENENGSYLAEKVLNGYLQLRRNYWTTPKAVFNIIGAGSKLLSGFMPLTSNDLTVEGQWIGVAICAVIFNKNIDDIMEAKYVVTAHIEVGGVPRKIPFPVNYLMAGLKNQLVFYWTVPEDFHRVLDPKQKNNFRFSFSVEPKDGNLQVFKFGVCFIRDEDIPWLKRYEESTSRVAGNLLHATILCLRDDLQWYVRACEEADTDLRSFDLIIHDLTRKILKFILENGKHRNSLDGISKIIECLIGINQQVLIKCKEEWRDRELFSLVCDYYQISHGTSQLFIDFVRLLKDVSDSWSSVKLALEQILVKRRANDYTYEKMLQELDDLEAAQSVRFSDKFIISFAYICKQAFALSRHLNKEIRSNINFKSVKVLAKVSSVTIACGLSMVAKYFGDPELLQEMKDITSYSMWLRVLQSFSEKSDEWFDNGREYMKASCCDRELQIWDFYENANLLQEFKNKMRGFSYVTNENEAEMMIVIHKLEKKIDNISATIEDMSSHAHKYILDMREVGITLKPSISHGNLQMTIFGACFVSDEQIQQLQRVKISVSEAMNILYQATLCHSLSYTRQHESLNGIHKIFEVLYQMNQMVLIISSECRDKTDLAFSHYYDSVHREVFELYNNFVRLLKDVSDSWLSVKLALEKFVVKSSAADYPYEEMVQQLHDLGAAESVRISYHSFLISLHHICHMLKLFLGRFNYMMLANEKFKLVMDEIPRVTIAGVFSVLATYIGDSKVSKELKDISSDSMLLELIERISKEGGEWFNEKGELVKRSYGGELQIWDFYGDAILHELKKKMDRYDYFNKEIAEEMKIVIDNLETMISNFSETIEDMHNYPNYTTKCHNDRGRKRKFTVDLFENRPIADKHIQRQKRHVASVSDASSILYPATESSFACEADINIHLCHSIIHDHISSTIKFFLDYGKQRDSLASIVKIFECLYNNNECAIKCFYNNDMYPKYKWQASLGYDYDQICIGIFSFYYYFSRVLEDISHSWSSVKLELEEIVVQSRANNHTYKEMLLKLDYLIAKSSVGQFYNRFIELFASTTEQSVDYLRSFNEKLQSNEYINSVRELAQVSRLTIIGVFSLQAAYMGDLELLESLKHITSNLKLFNLIKSFSRKGGKWFDEKGELRERSYGGELQIWNLLSNEIVHELKRKIYLYDCFTQDVEEEIKIVIVKLKKNICNFSKTIDDMTSSAAMYVLNLSRIIDQPLLTIKPV